MVVCLGLLSGWRTKGFSKLGLFMIVWLGLLSSLDSEDPMKVVGLDWKHLLNAAVLGLKDPWVKCLYDLIVTSVIIKENKSYSIFEKHVSLSTPQVPKLTDLMK